MIETGASDPLGGRGMLSWCMSVATAWSALCLHPPAAFALEDCDERYRCLHTFGPGSCDLAIGNTPLLRRRIRARTTLFVEPGVRLAMRSAEVFEFLLVSVDRDHVHRLADAAAQQRAWHTHTLLDHQDPALTTLGAELRRALLFDALPLPAYLQSLADAITLRLFSHFLGEIENAKRGEALSPALLRRILLHVDAHLAEHLTVDELANMTGLTRSHFSRAFRQMTGDPPRRFITKRRICRARDLLSSSDSPLADIAIRTGFSSQAHLSTAFRKELATTPALYRAAFRSRGSEAVIESEVGPLAPTGGPAGRGLSTTKTGSPDAD